MIGQDDDLLFAPEAEETRQQPVASPAFPHAQPWKILIVDDEEEVHAVTRLVLKDYVFGGRSLQFLPAYTFAEARELLRQHDDVALALIDVVMESDTAGLELVKYIRDQLNNKFMRLVLRTGQPGQAPEEAVIATYDINDYKDKTELTATKLRTLMYSALRSYRDIMTLHETRQGLELIIESSAKIFEVQSLAKFTSAVLRQLTALLNLGQDAAFFRVASGFAAISRGDHYHIMAGIGRYEHSADQPTTALVDGQILRELDLALQAKRHLYFDDRMVAYFATNTGIENLLYLTDIERLSEVDRHLIDTYCANVAIAFENTHLREEIEHTQTEIVYMLGEAVETRSKETGHHVKRVAEISSLLALRLGLSEDEAARIKAASPLHDLGKIGIPDGILHKPGKLTGEEWEFMKQHVMIGYDMLKHSKRAILQASAIIARDHHEHWDGAGYPQQVRGQDIHIYGRITAIADVFDALAGKRCYKEPWPLSAIIDHFRAQSGHQFDPQLVELLLDNLEPVIAICDRFKDDWSGSDLKNQWLSLGHL